MPPLSVSAAQLRLTVLRLVWVLVFATVLLMYTVGLPDRLDQLVLVMPFPAYWAYLDIYEAAVLTGFGIPEQAYFWALLSVELLLGITCIVVGGLMFLRRNNNSGAILCSLMVLALGGSESSFTGALTRVDETWFLLRQFLQAMGIGITLIVFYTFPDGRFTPHWTRPLAAVYGTIVLIWAFFLDVPFNPIPHASFGRTPLLSVLHLFAWYLTGVIALIIRYRRHADPIQRQQMKWALFGLFFGFSVAFTHYGITALNNAFPIFTTNESRFLFEFLRHTLYWLGYTVAAVAFGFAMLRYRLWDIDFVIRRALAYALLSVTLLGVTVATIIVFQQGLRLFSAQQSSAAIVLATLLGALLFQPLRNRLQTLIDRRFDRTRVDFQAAFTTFARELRAMIALPDLLRFLLLRSTDLLRITHGAVYLRTSEGAFVLADSANVPASAPPNLSPELVIQVPPGEALSRPGDPLFPLILPLLALRDGRNELVGVLALGPRKSEQPYSKDDRALLVSLADQAGTAISVAQLVAAERSLAAYRASPAGRAEARAQIFPAQAAAAIVQIHELAIEALNDAERAQELETLPTALRRIGASAQADLAEGYRSVVADQGDGSRIQVGLRQISTTLHSLDDPLSQHLFDTLGAALDADSAYAIGGLADSFERLSHDPQLRVLFGVHIQTAVMSLRSVPHILGSIAQLHEPAEHLYCLERARDRIAESERQIPTMLDNLSHRLINAIISHWRQVIGAELQAIFGRAELVLRLISGHVVAAPELLIGVEIQNRGIGPAAGVRLELQPQPDLLVLGEPLPPFDLAPGTAHVVRFPIICTAIRPTLHLEFRMTVAEGASVQSIRFPVALLAVPAWNGLITNPYLAGRPLAPNSGLFVGRDDDIAFFMQAMLRPDPTALVLSGQRRMGKTSLLRHLAGTVGAQHVTVYLDGQILGMEGGMARLWYDIALRIARAAGLPTPAPTHFAAEPTNTWLHDWLPSVLRACVGRRLLLLLDEIEALEERVAQGRIDPGFFAVLRHLMQHEAQVAIIYAGAHRLDALLPTLGTGMLNAALHRRLGSLSSESSRRLLVEPVADQLRYDDLALDEALRQTGGHPYFLQLFGQVIVDQANDAQRSVVRFQHVQQALVTVLELAEAPLSDLWFDSDPTERLVLSVMAQQSIIAAFTSAQRLITTVQGLHISPDHGRIEAGLQQLARRDILRHHDDALRAGVGYSWRLGLFAQWIRQNQTLPSDKLRASNTVA